MRPLASHPAGRRHHQRFFARETALGGCALLLAQANPRRTAGRRPPGRAGKAPLQVTACQASASKRHANAPNAPTAPTTAAARYGHAGPCKGAPRPCKARAWALRLCHAQNSRGIQVFPSLPLSPSLLFRLSLSSLFPLFLVCLCSFVSLCPVPVAKPSNHERQHGSGTS